MILEAPHVWARRLALSQRLEISTHPASRYALSMAVKNVPWEPKPRP